MLKYLKLENVGPAAEMELNLAPRLNIITGDNGLGKSFLLDVAWFVSFDHWPKEENPRLNSGYIASPRDKAKEASIGSKAQFLGSAPSGTFYVSTSKFDRRNQCWSLLEGEVSSFRPGVLTMYAMADGAMAIFDPFRNYLASQKIGHLQTQRLGRDVPNAFVFSQSEIWDGLVIPQKDKEDKILCNGLIRDWSSWQNKNGRPFEALERVLAALSEDKTRPMRPGEQTRISIDDVRDMPTVKMPYSGHENEDIAVVHASAGIRRIISIAYLLVWMWEEHLRVAEILGQRPCDEILILFDEVECHLHPTWQRKIVPALLEAVKVLSKDISVQLIATTHSPLVMASLEPHFDAEKDQWFDLDLVRDNGSKPEVKLTERPFRKYGDAESWLHSRAFDLSSTRSLEGEALLKEAKKLMGQSDPSPEAINSMHQRLVDSLDAMDEFLDYWRLFWRKKRGAE